MWLASTIYNSFWLQAFHQPTLTTNVAPKQSSLENLICDILQKNSIVNIADDKIHQFTINPCPIITLQFMQNGTKGYVVDVWNGLKNTMITYVQVLS